jgi:hypothetical protein
METRVKLQIARQPDDTTCGPTCLHAIYRYHGDSISLPRVIREVRHLRTGGTLAVFLANHALARGYRARIYTYNLQAWDPSWFRDESVPFSRRLRSQLRAKGGEHLGALTRGFLEFFRLGGEVSMAELTPGLISRFLRAGTPILAGLSATYLYQSPREVGEDNRPDDIRGRPSGHFVLLCGYNRRTRRVLVADPLLPNPFDSHVYRVGIYRLVGAILLGILTFDANVLVIEPGERRLGAATRRGSGRGRWGRRWGGRADAGRT